MIQTWVVFMFISLLTGCYVDDNYVMVIILGALVKYVLDDVSLQNIYI